ncbi:MAG: hypothetical protein WCG42_07395 [Parachlamydiaceae bacterium]
MFDTALFLGFPVDASYAQKLRGADPVLVGVFIHGANGEYLSDVQNEGCRYLGRFIASSVTVADLSLLEQNIYSILKKVTPHERVDLVPLVLFTIQKTA